MQTFFPCCPWHRTGTTLVFEDHNLVGVIHSKGLMTQLSLFIILTLALAKLVSQSYSLFVCYNVWEGRFHIDRMERDGGLLACIRVRLLLSNCRSQYPVRLRVPDPLWDFLVCLFQCLNIPLGLEAMVASL